MYYMIPELINYPNEYIFKQFLGISGRSLPGILRCIDVMSLMQDQLAILSGGRDRRGKKFSL